MIGYLTFFLCLVDLYLAKICWKECDPSQKVIQSVDVANCTRRSTYPELEDFWCDGEKGPPCFVQKGKTEVLEVVWANPGVADMAQSAHMLTFIEMPWIGMETEACSFLDGGKVCRYVLKSTSILSKMKSYILPGLQTKCRAGYE